MQNFRALGVPPQDPPNQPPPLRISGYAPDFMHCVIIAEAEAVSIAVKVSMRAVHWHLSKLIANFCVFLHSI